MSFWKKKSFWSVLLLITLLLTGLILLFYPLNLMSRSPLVIIKHHGSSSVDSRIMRDRQALKDAERRSREAQNALDRARMEVWNARIPRANFQSANRYNDIQRAELAADRALNDLRNTRDDEYLLRRRLESDLRAQRLHQERKAFQRQKPIEKHPKLPAKIKRDPRFP